MNRGRIIKIVAVALLISMIFPLTVAADPPPPGEPSPLSPVILPNESFEGFVFPPSGWKVIRTNANWTWMQLGLPYFLPHSGGQAAVVIADADPQDEVLLTPKVSGGGGMAVVFSSMTWDVAKCQPDDDVCDLEVWLVKGAWDAGAGNDVLLGTVDSTWTTDDKWEFQAYLVDLSHYYKPVRIGFRYVGQGGDAIAVDDVMILAYAMNQNYSFEDGGKMPKAWKGKNLTAKDKRDNSQATDGSWSFKMVGSSAKKSLFQTIDVSGYAYDVLGLFGCSKSKNAKAGRPYQVVVTIVHQDGSRQRHRIKFSPGTHGWQCKDNLFQIKEHYKRIDLEIRYWKQGGKAWFDEVYVVSPL